VWNCPTLINNCESLCCVPHIINNGGEWYAQLVPAPKTRAARKIFSVSGHVNKPGNYEIEFGMPLMELIELAGGVRGGKTQGHYPWRLVDADSARPRSARTPSSATRS
jgi:NADH-quinone oxidoreductase subunit F